MELKELRKRLKEEGYKIRTKRLSSLGDKRFGDIYKNGEQIVGSGTSAYFKDHVEKHQVAFNIYNQAKEEGVFDKQEKIIL